MSFEPKKPAIDVIEVRYYFDAMERDSIDRMSHTRRSSEVLAIREKLLTLPDRDFTAVVQTIKNILSPSSAPDSIDIDPKSKRREAVELYDKTRRENQSNPLKINPL